MPPRNCWLLNRKSVEPLGRRSAARASSLLAVCELLAHSGPEAARIRSCAGFLPTPAPE